MSGRDLLLFTQALLRSPREVGAIAPSSFVLGDRLAAVVPRRDDAVIVELGAGTGVVTTRIERRRSPKSTFLVFERNSQLATEVRRQVPGAHVIADDARRLRLHLEEHSLTTVDAIVCGLPWANFSQEEQSELLDVITSVLGTGGVFTTFAYVHALVLPQARQFRDALAARFDEVLPTRTVLRNLPPAITYVCRTPLARR
jgi:phosphatidylethanolamine/phosphatidyl-N-methylethanolamine N-methyltransferase